MLFTSVSLDLEMMSRGGMTKRASVIHTQPFVNAVSKEAVMAIRYKSERLFGFEIRQAYRT